MAMAHLICYLMVCLIQHQLKATVTVAHAQPTVEVSITSPLAYNAFLNSEDPGTFTCVTRNSDDVLWIIESSIHITPYVRDTRLIEERTINGNNTQHSIIMIPAIPVNQHIASIKCKAYIIYGDFQEAESVETAQFNVQGLLDMPPNITYSSYNISYNLIEWLEPETLNITNVEPDIENYTICTNVTDECVNTTTTHFILPKYFVDVVINVTAWNIVGESNSSAQLEIGACTSNSELVVTVGEKYYLEVSFDENGLVLLHFHTNEQIMLEGQESSTPSIKECPYLYKVIIHQKNDQLTIATRQVYGYHHSVRLKVPLTRNRLYTVNVNRTTLSTHFSLNQVDFSTYEIKNVSIVKDGRVLQIMYDLSVGATAEGFTVELFIREKELLLEKSFNISRECSLSTHTRSCSVHISLGLPPLPHVGNFTLSICGWEKSGWVVNKLYFREFAFEALSKTTNVTSDNSTHTQETVLTITVVLVTVGSGAVGTIGLVSLFIIVYKALRRRITKKPGHHYSKHSHRLRFGNINPLVYLDQTYSDTLQMSHNQAYETANKAQATNVYEEISSAPASEPVYAEVAEKPNTVQKNTG